MRRSVGEVLTRAVGFGSCRKIEASIQIQSMFRVFKARRKARAELKRVVQKFIDQNTGLPYWFNPRTGVTTWVKPALLGDEDVASAVAVAEPDVECVLAHALCDPGAHAFVSSGM